MKNLLYFSLIGLLLAVGACKKDNRVADPCNGVTCLNGGICVNGFCVCDVGWTGADCNTAIIPIDSFTGDYHMTGNTTIYNSGQPPAITPIDDTLAVARVNDSTLSFNGFELLYNTTQADSFYRYANNSAYRTIFLKFHKPFTDDSAFYDLNDSSPVGTGATIIKMSGVKIH